MADADVLWLDATGQAELVRTGELSASELIELAIDAIDRIDPQLNAVIHHLGDKARAAATAGELGDGPFTGVPMLVKDIVAHTAGDPYHCGMQVLKDAGWTEPDDAYLVRRFRAAGFNVCGKTNLPELAFDVTTEPVAYGPTHNPWNLDHSPGGSSGGSGAAVAAGLVPVAHANDMGGSIRIPASHCGLVGLKPSRARTSLGPRFGEVWGMLCHEHVITRSVRDTAGVLDCTAGAWPGDPYTAPPPARPFLEEVGADPGRLRIGLRHTVPPDGAASDPECAAAVEATGALLASLGHSVESGSPAALDDAEFMQIGLLFSAAAARELDRWGDELGRKLAADDVEPGTWAMAEVGWGTSAPQLLAAQEYAHSWSRRMASWWADDGFDLLVTPTVGVPPRRLGLGELQPGEVSFTMPSDVTGQPAVSLPLHWTADGLPIGVQLTAAAWREDLLLRVAAQLEQVQPWAGRRPPVHA